MRLLGFVERKNSANEQNHTQSGVQYSLEFSGLVRYVDLDAQKVERFGVGHNRVDAKIAYHEAYDDKRKGYEFRTVHS